MKYDKIYLNISTIRGHIWGKKAEEGDTSLAPPSDYRYVTIAIVGAVAPPCVYLGQHSGEIVLKFNIIPLFLLFWNRLRQHSLWNELACTPVPLEGDQSLRQS